MSFRFLSACCLCASVCLLLSAPAAESKVSSSSSFFLKQLSKAAKAMAAGTRSHTSSPIFYVKQLLHRRPNSPIHRLPLKLLGNGKPSSFIQGLIPSKPAQSNLLHLPLQFLSNGKPTGISLNGINGGLLPTMGTSIQPLLLRPMNELIRLPLQFLSNARPIGLNVFQNPFHQLTPLHVTPPVASNFIHLPLQFLSNARPFGVNINPFIY